MTAKLQTTNRALLEQLAAQGERRNEQIDRLIQIQRALLTRIARLEQQPNLTAAAEQMSRYMGRWPWTDRRGDRR